VASVKDLLQEEAGFGPPTYELPGGLVRHSRSGDQWRSHRVLPQIVFLPAEREGFGTKFVWILLVRDSLKRNRRTTVALSSVGPRTSMRTGGGTLRNVRGGARLRTLGVSSNVPDRMQLVAGTRNRIEGSARN
jgi:hypothetical protein